METSELWRSWLLASAQELADNIRCGSLNVWLDRAGYIGRKNENSQIADQVVVVRPEYARTPWAKFSPAKAGSGNQLAIAREETVRSYKKRSASTSCSVATNQAVSASAFSIAQTFYMAGYGDKPLILTEGKVLAGKVNHPKMNASMWKKLPSWIDDPAAVFMSDTVDNRLVFIAPGLIDGAPARIIIEPNAEVGGLDVHIAVNA